METQKRARENIKSTSGANENLRALNGRIPKNTRKEVKNISQGEAIFSPFEIALEFRTPSNPPTTIAPVMMRII